MPQICKPRNHYIHEEKTNEITTDSAVIKIIMFNYINFRFDFIALDNVDYKITSSTNCFLSHLKHSQSVLISDITHSAVASCFISARVLNST